MWPRSTTNVSEEPSMSILTPELRAEIIARTEERI
jgi:hypothetical protein